MYTNILCLCLTLVFACIYTQRTNKCDNTTTLRCNYIPPIVPTGIFKVQIEDFVQESTDIVEVKKSDFKQESWSHVTHLDISSHFDSESTRLKFQANSFGNLKALKKIEIHITHAFELDADTFVGLDNVETLDMSNCARLSLDTLIYALKGESKLKSLENLIISKISYIVGPTYFDGGLVDALRSKTKFKTLDFSGTQFSIIRPFTLPNLMSLEVFNLSYSNIGTVSNNHPAVNDFARLKMLDISYASIPLQALPLPIGKLDITDWIYDPPATERFSIIFAPQTVNISGILPSALSLKNCSFNLKEDLDLHVQHLISKENNLKYLDLFLNCKNLTLNSIISWDLSGNGLQFLHPSILSCIPNITRLDLSRNEFSIMASIDFEQFQNLFTGLKYLQEINLSRNNIITTPWNLFQKNQDLELIDLSYNGLTQITFTLEHASRLHTLLLHNNQIHVLDSKSISSLTNIPIASMSRENTTNITVTLYNNPLRCSQCDNKPFLEWLLTTERVNINHGHLECYATESVILDMDNDVIKHVESICQRERIIIGSTVSVVTVLLLIVALVIVKCLRKRHNERKNRTEKVIRLLTQGKNQYEFAVFLSYSSADDEFVKTCVLKQLGDVLKEITGIKRTLICEGDNNLRPGFYVLEETILCIQRSGVVIVVVSNHFCESNYCDTELLQAYNLKKPILLVLRENVQEDRMRPVMKLLFQQNVRVLFEEKNGVFILKSTWQHVGKSIIDLLVQDL